MSQLPATKAGPQLSSALDRMVEALEMLDRLEAPGDIGSHLDLAIARLRDRLGLGGDQFLSVEALFATAGGDPLEADAWPGDLARGSDTASP